MNNICACIIGNEMEKIKIGQITGAVGLKGEVKVYDYGEDISRYKKFESVYIKDEKYKVEACRIHKNMAVLLLEGIDDRTKAEKMRGKDLFIGEEQLPKLPEGVYYIKDLIGFDVVGDNGEKIGVLKDILKNTSQPLYKVEALSGKDVYIPGVDAFILDTDTEKRKITVRIIEGLIES